MVRAEFGESFMSQAVIRSIEHGLMADCADQAHPSRIYGFCEGRSLTISGPGTVYGFVQSGEARISGSHHDRIVRREEYFSLVVDDRLVIEGGQGFAALRLDYAGLNAVGGPVERRGRLKYIDGCSDTLLISPPILGDPCLNLLHFPPGIEQTMHTHPSIRAGLVHAGRAYCRTPDGQQDLRAGDLFILYPDAIHAFATSQAESMALTVFHPDSDHGPTHDQHPMLNRTMVNGVSARHIDAIRTAEIV